MSDQKAKRETRTHTRAYAQGTGTCTFPDIHGYCTHADADADADALSIIAFTRTTYLVPHVASRHDDDILDADADSRERRKDG